MFLCEETEIDHEEEEERMTTWLPSLETLYRLKTGERAQTATLFGMDCMVNLNRLSIAAKVCYLGLVYC